MELRLYFYLLRKWAWLLILGAIVGGALGYFFSVRQPKMYQSGTRVMVMRSPEERASEYSTVFSDIQLAKTYTQLIATGPVLDALGGKLGYPVKGAQIRVSQVPESFILEVTVRDQDPKKTADIANSLVGVFIEYNESLLNSRFSNSEESLQAQINQLENQINALREEMSQISEENVRSQKQKVEEELARLEPEINRINQEITVIFPPTPFPRPGEIPQQVILDPSQQTALDDLQRQLEQLQKRYDLYTEIYLNLVVLGEPVSSGSQNTRQDQIQTTLNLYQQIYTNLLNNYENVRLARLRSTPNVVQIEPAGVPSSPVQPQPMRNAMIWAAAGFLLTGMIAFLIEYLDDTIKTPEDVVRQLRLPVIGMIGEMEIPKGEKPGIFVSEYPRAPIAESFRSLRTNLDFAAVDQTLKSILVTSANPSEGKSTVAVNLAAVFAQGEKKVILMDADLRRPSSHRFFRIPNRKGLSDVFRHQLSLENALVAIEDLPLRVLPCGSVPPNPAELLSSVKMGEILEELEQMADMVVIDSPPFIVADPVSLAAKADGVIIVIEPGGTRLDAAHAMLETLSRSGARILGIVLNPITRRGASYYSGRYRYYSDYYYARSYGYVRPESTRQQKTNKKKDISPPTRPAKQADSQ
jgi:capsular exopolysaccharide synthesis family protein